MIGQTHSTLDRLLTVKCPFCKHLDTRVIDSRINQNGDLIRRRRECPECTDRFTSYERIEEVMPKVIKKDGRRETFQREKLVGGIEKACQKRPVDTKQIEKLIHRVEKKIRHAGLREIPSRVIGQMVMMEIHQLDKVAYIRFASVYREFDDVDDFVEELKDPSILEKEFEKNVEALLPFADDFGSEEHETPSMS